MKLYLQDAIDRYNATKPDDEPMTQVRLAEMVGTTQSLVNKHLRGRVMPGPKFLQRYASVLDTTVDALLFGVEDMRGVA